MAEEAESSRPTEDEIRDQLEAELRKLKVSDLLLQTIFTVSQLGFHKLREDERDLEQARLAIESLRALIPVLAEAVPGEVTRDLNQMLANLQLSYAEAVAATRPDGER